MGTRTNRTNFGLPTAYWRLLGQNNSQGVGSIWRCSGRIPFCVVVLELARNDKYWRSFIYSHAEKPEKRREGESEERGFSFSAVSLASVIDCPHLSRQMNFRSLSELYCLQTTAPLVRAFVTLPMVVPLRSLFLIFFNVLEAS